MPKQVDSLLAVEQYRRTHSAPSPEARGSALAPSPASVHRLQQAAGNAAVQRLLAQRKPKSLGQQDKEQEELLPTQSLQRQAARAAAVQRLTTTFDLTKPAPIRSNTDSSTTRGENPTFTGSVTKDDKRKRWGYQLDTAEAKGKIQIVYYTSDRYPAPTPEDDSGALTNVTNANWKAIVKDLKKNRTGIAANWSSYLAEDTHEAFHWEGEWQKLVRAGLKVADKKVKALRATYADKSLQTDAEADLKPQATTIFNGQMNKARTKWNAKGDDPGDPPYKAQAPSVDAVVKRVEAHAKAQKWK